MMIIGICFPIHEVYILIISSAKQTPFAIFSVQTLHILLYFCRISLAAHVRSYAVSIILRKFCQFMHFQLIS